MTFYGYRSVFITRKHCVYEYTKPNVSEFILIFSNNKNLQFHFVHFPCICHKAKPFIS